MAPRLRLTFQSHTPLSIKIAAALFLAFQVYVIKSIAPTPAAARTLLSHPLALGALAACVILTVWVVVATWRLSRWPLLVLPVLMATYGIWSSQIAPRGIVPSLVNFAIEFTTWPTMAVLVVPHWRRLNWRPLGRLPTPADVAEHFD